MKSLQSRCRGTARFSRRAISALLVTDAQPHRTPDPTTGLRFVQPERDRPGIRCRFNRGKADGKILVGGFSTSADRSNSIARLDPTTGSADSFDPQAGHPLGFPTVQAIALQADGRILVCGDFTVIGGQPRFGFARLDAITGLADSFNPKANNRVYAIAAHADGKILAGGNFSGESKPATASPARCHDRPGRFIRPERERCCPFNRGAGGRQDFSWRLVHHALAERRSGGDAQPHRPSGNRRQARPDAQSQPSAPMLLPPPCRRTVRLLSAAASAQFWE